MMNFEQEIKTSKCFTILCHFFLPSLSLSLPLSSFIFIFFFSVCWNRGTQKIFVFFLGLYWKRIHLDLFYYVFFCSLWEWLSKIEDYFIVGMKERERGRERIRNNPKILCLHNFRLLLSQSWLIYDAFFDLKHSSERCLKKEKRRKVFFSENPGKIPGVKAIKLAWRYRAHLLASHNLPSFFSFSPSRFPLLFFLIFSFSFCSFFFFLHSNCFINSGLGLALFD